MNSTLDPSSDLANRVWFLEFQGSPHRRRAGTLHQARQPPADGRGTGSELGLHPRGIEDFFDALVAMKFLDREGDGPEARYFNTPAGAMYLDEKSPRYIGGILAMLNVRLFKFWHDLPEALRTGKPQNEIKHGEKGMFEELYTDPVETGTIPRRDDRPVAAQLRSVRREIRFLEIQNALRHRRRDRLALHRSGKETSAPPMRLV